MQCPIWKPCVVFVLVLVYRLHAVKSAVQNQIVTLETSGAQANTAEMERQEFLDAHNKIRAEHGEPPYTWDPKLELFAKQYFEQRYHDCKLVHSEGPYGENIYWGGTDKWKALDAVTRWASEIKNFRSESNACLDGKVCGHYTQIVWRDSVRLGCFREVCRNGDTYIICNYDPPGNRPGQSPFDDHGRRDGLSPPENQTSQANDTAPPPEAYDTGPPPKANGTVPPPEANGTALPPAANGTESPPEANGTAPPPEANKTMSPPEANHSAPPDAHDTGPPDAHDTVPPDAPPPEANVTASPQANITAPPQANVTAPSQANVTAPPQGNVTRPLGMDEQEFLDGHNKIRSLHGLPPYTWDPKLQLFAKQYCEQHYEDCNLDSSGGPYGESIAKASAEYFGDKASDVVKELANIDKNCYKQIVSRESVRLGCHQGKCKSGESCIICEYEPRGNSSDW